MYVCLSTNIYITETADRPPGWDLELDASAKLVWITTGSSESLIPPEETQTFIIRFVKKTVLKRSFFYILALTSKFCI